MLSKFLLMINRYVATFCDFKKKYFLMSFMLPYSSTCPRFKNRRPIEKKVKA